MSVSLTSKKYKRKRRTLDIFSLLFTLFLAISFVAIGSFIVLKLYYTITTMDYFSLKKIEIKGNEMLTYNDITSYLDLRLGDNLFSLNISELNRKLRRNPWVYESIIKRTIPDKLSIEIKEKEPFFLLKENDKIFYADINGDRIDVLNPKKYLSLPLLVKRDNISLKPIVFALREKGFPFSWQKIGGIKVKGKEVRLFIDGYNLWISLERKGLEGEITFLKKVFMDLKLKKELDRVREVKIAGNRAWVSYVH